MHVIATGGELIRGYGGRVALGGDERSYGMRELMKDYLDECRIAYTDVGTGRCMDIVSSLADALLGNECTHALAFTALGHDAAIAANKVPQVRCAMGDKPTRVVLSRQQNDVNMLAIGTDITAFGVAMESVWKLLATAFLGRASAGRSACAQDMENHSSREASNMKVAIGADRDGYILKETIANHLREKSIEFFDFGCYELERADYAVYARKVGEAVASGQYDRGILIDSSGVGMAIVANKIKDVRAAQVGEAYSARMTRRHNDANVLCFGGRITGAAVALSCVDVWLETAFDGGDHALRLAELDQMRARYRKDDADDEC